MKTCDKCGHVIADDGDYVLSEMERHIIEVLRDVRRSPLSPTSTIRIASEMGYHPRTIRYHLTQLKRRGIVSLPMGRCSGWIEGDVLSELASIIAGCRHME